MRVRDAAPTVLLLVGLFTTAVRAQDPLDTARGMYAAAAYEDALLVLNGLRVDAGHVAERPRIEEYRAFCLLALGRGDEAELAIEALIGAEPSYRPSEREASPRVRTAFAEVRRRVLPAVVQQRYTAAKAAFHRRQHAAAAEGFALVLALLDDPDMAAALTQPPLVDIGTLAAGFRELAVAADAPPPVPTPERRPVSEPAPAPAPSGPLSWP